MEDGKSKQMDYRKGARRPRMPTAAQLRRPRRRVALAESSKLGEWTAVAASATVEPIAAELAKANAT